MQTEIQNLIDHPAAMQKALNLKQLDGLIRKVTAVWGQTITIRYRVSEGRSEARFDAESEQDLVGSSGIFAKVLTKCKIDTFNSCLTLNKVLVADTNGFCTSEILPLDFGEYIIPEYARCVLMSKMFLDYTAQCGYGVKMPRLGTEDGRKALFPLPSKAEQQRIVETIQQYRQIIQFAQA